jgi:hypothetical protein
MSLASFTDSVDRWSCPDVEVLLGHRTGSREVSQLGSHSYTSSRLRIQP